MPNIRMYKSGLSLWQWLFGCKQCRVKRGWHKLDCSNARYSLIKRPLGKDNWDK